MGRAVIPMGQQLGVLQGWSTPRRGVGEVSRGQDPHEGPAGQGHPVGERWGLHRGILQGKGGDSLWGKGQAVPMGVQQGKASPPRGRLSPPLTLAAAPAAAVLALAGPGTGAGVTWGGRAAVSRETGQDGTGPAGHSRDGALTGGTCAVLGVHGLAWFSWLRLGSARLGSQQYRPALTARYL